MSYSKSFYNFVSAMPTNNWFHYTTHFDWYQFECNFIQWLITSSYLSEDKFKVFVYSVILFLYE